MNRVFVSEHIKETEVEQTILGKELTRTNQNALVYLAWNEKIDSNFFDAFPHLKAVIRYGVGYDNVDVKEATRRNIKVCIVPDYGVDEVAQTAAAVIIEKSRNIYKYNKLSKLRYQTKTWQVPDESIRRTSTLKVGIVGAGRIGSKVLKYCKSFGFDVSFYDPYVAPGYEKVLECKRTKCVKDILSKSDFISLHVPCNEETRGMVDIEFLKSMKNGSSLINTARGDLISDYRDLEYAIDNKLLSFVYLDVLKTEPPQSHSFLDKWKNGQYQDRVVINPHTAFYSQESFVEMRTKACESAISIINNHDPYCEVYK